ncbi:hypothetical protein CEUSTIGMA_g6977.t1 [Chlamydomonas eustigma]|uniref:EF-hand domain-containing protein n=1 Tax=Chlamydomonas eustigma TaxID=1157962 RepID=A0A250X8Z6_9CHLO|nr:hypothetical protein CEUSTIGMA_g6977.t1 [Chlamydomonas eustigma]|eukprot:GAX79536.1 hypothetical protein CEUSTIGMA_g6977.t1 [Chlamydomonas eustigma]
MRVPGTTVQSFFELRKKGTNTTIEGIIENRNIKMGCGASTEALVNEVAAAAEPLESPKLKAEINQVEQAVASAVQTQAKATTEPVKNATTAAPEEPAATTTQAAINRGAPQESDAADKQTDADPASESEPPPPPAAIDSQDAAPAVFSSVPQAASSTAAAMPRDSVHLTPRAVNVLKRLDRLLKKEYERLEGMFAQFDNDQGYFLEKDLADFIDFFVHDCLAGDVALVASFMMATTTDGKLTLQGLMAGTEAVALREHADLNAPEEVTSPLPSADATMPAEEESHPTLATLVNHAEETDEQLEAPGTEAAESAGKTAAVDDEPPILTDEEKAAASFVADTEEEETA